MLVANIAEDATDDVRKSLICADKGPPHGLVNRSFGPAFIQ
jgi:hypothetical protein